MRPILTLAFAALTLLAGTASAQTPDLYLNHHYGFDIEGFHYDQSQFPCEVDATLTRKLIEEGSEAGLKIEAAGTADKLKNAPIPVLAIDFQRLALGREGHNYGTNRNPELPSAKVTAALIDTDLPDGYITENHSCAITSLKRFNPSSNVLDLGSGGVTHCDAMHACLGDMSRDIIRWVEQTLNAER